MANQKKQLSPDQKEALLSVLQARFAKNPARHEGLEWDKVLLKLESNPEKVASLHEMELTEGEPDVIGYDREKDEYLFCDCSAESPKGRRSLCYDRKALDARKENKPVNSAMDLAAEMGTEILTEAMYRELQQLGKFDLKTSSWVETPAAIRELGGALFCDRRYNTVFVYHNGADSYYGARGFRAFLRV